MTSEETMASQLLREARRRAGLTQQQMAGAAGITQSVLSAYETGRRQPSLPMLRRLVAAAGADLQVTLQGTGQEVRPLSGPLGRRLARHRQQVRAVAEQHGFRNVRVFGSVARGDETSRSDIDLLVDAPAEGVGLLGLARFQRDVEAVLGAPVEIVLTGELRPAVADRIDGDLVTL